jgi:uncharacterized protein (DUF302 family)
MEMMKKFLLILACGFTLFANDIIIKESRCSVDNTIKNIKDIVELRGLTFFAIINHRGNAKYVDMNLNESKMIIFGSAKIGTPLMQQDMLVGLDLPIRILVFRDNEGKVKIAYRDGSWLKGKHIIDSPKLVKKLNRSLDDITTKAGQCKKD